MDFCAPVDDAMDVSTASKNLPVTGSSSSPRASRTKPKLPDYDLYKVSGRDAFRILTEEIKYGKFASDVHSINKTFITQHQMEELWEDLVYLHHTRWLKEHMSIEGTVSSRVKAKKRNLGKAVAQVGRLRYRTVYSD